MPGYLAAVAVGVLLQGLVAHAVNEIADWRSGTDADPAPRVISGGSKVIASGLLTPGETAGGRHRRRGGRRGPGPDRRGDMGLVARPLRPGRAGRGGPVHAAAGPRRVPAAGRRGDRAHLHLGLHDRRLPAAARLARRRGGGAGAGPRRVLRGHADDASLPGPRSGQSRPAAQGHHDGAPGRRRPPLRGGLGRHGAGTGGPAGGMGRRGLRAPGGRHGACRWRCTSPSTRTTRARSRAPSSA